MFEAMLKKGVENLEELVDSLMRRMAAAERLMASLSNEQREVLANLMTQALDDAGLDAAMRTWKPGRSPTSPAAPIGWRGPTTLAVPARNASARWPTRSSVPE